MIKRGSARGSIMRDNMLKAFVDGDAVWIHVIALNQNRTKGIGVMQNTTTSGNFEWGEFVEFKENDDPSKIPVIISKVTRIPSDSGWSTSF